MVAGVPRRGRLGAPRRRARRALVIAARRPQPPHDCSSPRSASAQLLLALTFFAWLGPAAEHARHATAIPLPFDVTIDVGALTLARPARPVVVLVPLLAAGAVRDAPLHDDRQADPGRRRRTPTPPAGRHLGAGGRRRRVDDRRRPRRDQRDPRRAAPGASTSRPSVPRCCCARSARRRSAASPACRGLRRRRRPRHRRGRRAERRPATPGRPDGRLRRRPRRAVRPVARRSAPRARATTERARRRARPVRIPAPHRRPLHRARSRPLRDRARRCSSAVRRAAAAAVRAEGKRFLLSLTLVFALVGMSLVVADRLGRTGQPRPVRVHRCRRVHRRADDRRRLVAARPRWSSPVAIGACRRRHRHPGAAAVRTHAGRHHARLRRRRAGVVVPPAWFAPAGADDHPRAQLSSASTPRQPAHRRTTRASRCSRSSRSRVAALRRFSRDGCIVAVRDNEPRRRRSASRPSSSRSRSSRCPGSSPRPPA